MEKRMFIASWYIYTETIATLTAAETGTGKLCNQRPYFLTKRDIHPVDLFTSRDLTTEPEALYYQLQRKAEKAETRTSESTTSSNRSQNIGEKLFR